MTLNPHTADPVGRDGLLRRTEETLAERGRVVLVGAAGVGRTTVAAALAARALRRGETVLSVAPEAMDHALHGAALTGLLGAMPDAFVADLPAPQRLAVNVALRREVPPPEGADPLALRTAVTTLLRALGEKGPVLLVVDDAQRMDVESAAVLRAALHLAPSQVRAVLVEPLHGGGREEGEDPGVLAGLGGPDVVIVPPLDVDEIAELLVSHGLAHRLAGRIHQASGGNVRLALTLGRSLRITRRVVHHADGLPLTGQVRLAARRMLAQVSAPVRDTLLLAALAHRPTAALLRGAGRPADTELADAELAGLISLGEDGAVTFTAGVLSATLTAEADPRVRAAGHRALAAAVHDPVQAVRHEAFADPRRQDEALAAKLTSAAATARSRGDRAVAAELGLLAAERTPAAAPAASLERLVTAAQDAARAGRADLARRAANAILTREPGPRERVLARLAVFDTAGQGLAELDEDYARAERDAGDDIELRAAVRLRLAWRHMLADGDLRAAGEAAADAAGLAARAGDTATAAMALTLRARIERSLGDAVAEDTLARACALEAEAGASAGRLNPAGILTIRHAVFDDRLHEARGRLTALLPAVERGGTAEDVIEVCRTLAEVQARLGQCTQALGHARRSLEVTLEAGLSPGPAWYVSALAQTAGGSFTRAENYARRGIQASEEERDQVFLARNHYALGRLRLITGDVTGALRSLRCVQDLLSAQQVVDPSVLRWHEELALALVGADETAEAARILETARPVAERLGRTTVLIGLDRADAVRLAADGDPHTAAGLLTDAAARFAEADLPLEQGRTLLHLARVERRLRRRAPAQAALRCAGEIFARFGARPWLALTTAEPAVPRGERRAAAGESPAASSPLTEAELRLARLVCEGASNQEAAARMFLSVKTVEARLTRIYQKLGVRSRARLAAALRRS
ncbi:AAA family ATPase [Streptomyces sp. NPDC003023]|uniref:helix-turn-helix transcriptional regulator n=1 Tax=Streptomyces sp. NPDC003023 TaxID=3364675 RepID=UPI00369DD4A5